MDLSYHVDQTAELFTVAAARLRDAAKELERLRDSMVKNQDISYAGEALSVIVNIPQACRADLFAIRPIRAIQYGK